MPTTPSVAVVVALVVLTLLAVGVAAAGHLGTARQTATAAVRAVVQLCVVALVITAVLGSLAWSLLFTAAMLGIAVHTTARRVGAPRAWPWAAVAMASGIVPVLLVIFGTGAVPLDGPSLVPFAGIVTGGTMTAHSLMGRRVFAALRDERGAYEAALALGLLPRDAVDVVAADVVPEALVPGMDQTRTVGLVTLPGAFVGVILGGGTPAQAAAAQVLVLVGLLAAQSLTVTVAFQLVRRGRLVPDDLRSLVGRSSGA
ncbi:ABC transporter permease [Luteimicrobium subarcticum]|uniref:Putative ABC transport system permease protein n=1 Tax=Luteimicrobium subarcticum TaxID=620910 RepID=A0A2M8WV06_9MICO|nr:ABC transporter permease [Luteimicrobium subarcticum]PJI94706.1 putative ABC transport system permease protein [Luteimicrobium subarcticum]